MLLRVPRGQRLTSRLASTVRRTPSRPLSRTSLSAIEDCVPVKVEVRLNQSPSSELVRIEELSSTLTQPMFTEMPLPLLESVVRRTVAPSVCCVLTKMPERWLFEKVESSTMTLVPAVATRSAP